MRREYLSESLAKDTHSTMTAAKGQAKGETSKKAESKEETQGDTVKENTVN